ncbi:MAG: glycosyltransferase [Desulfobacteraceae bacterium]|nr:MAG: glycosyltransferase [Desulfobacteraceae bacterium]
MNPKPFIYFLCPDIDIPSGGINRIYRLAQISHEEGYAAHVLHQRQGFRNRWVPSVPPIRYWGNGFNLKKDDVVVIPESEPRAMQQLPEGIRKIVLALNWSYIFENLPMGDRWADYGIRQVLTASRVIEEFVRWTMDLPVYRIGVPIDHKLFYYDPQQKEPVLAYMAHRNSHGLWLEKIFRQLRRRITRWEWISIKDMTQSEYAAVLRKAKVFIGTGLREGVPGPILEAMASGAVVVGYGGVGGNEFIVPEGTGQNAFRVENHDYFALGKVLESVFGLLEGNDPKLDAVRQNGLQTVQPLTFESEKESLIRFWKEYL